MNRQLAAQAFQRRYGSKLPSSVTGFRSNQPKKCPKPPSSPPMSPLQSLSQPSQLPHSPDISMTPTSTNNCESTSNEIDNLLHQIDQTNQIMDQNNNNNNQSNVQSDNSSYDVLFNNNGSTNNTGNSTPNNSTPINSTPINSTPHNQNNNSPQSHNRVSLFRILRDIKPTICQLPSLRTRSTLDNRSLDIILAIDINLGKEWKGFIKYYGSNKFRAYYYQLMGLNRIMKLKHGVYLIPKELNKFENSDKNDYNKYNSTEALIGDTRNLNIFSSHDYIHVVKDLNNVYYCGCPLDKLRHGCKHRLMAQICDKYEKMEQKTPYKEISQNQILSDSVIRVFEEWKRVGMCNVLFLLLYLFVQFICFGCSLCDCK